MILPYSIRLDIYAHMYVILDANECVYICNMDLDDCVVLFDTRYSRICIHVCELGCMCLQIYT